MRRLGHQARESEKSRENAKEAGALRRGTASTGGAAEGDSEYWRGCGGRSALVHSVYTVGSNASGDLVGL